MPIDIYNYRRDLEVMTIHNRWRKFQRQNRPSRAAMMITFIATRMTTIYTVMTDDDGYVQPVRNR